MESWKAQKAGDKLGDNVGDKVRYKAVDEVGENRDKSGTKLDTKFAIN